MIVTSLQPWTIVVTRDEPPAGALHEALRAFGLTPISCAVMEVQPPVDPAPLRRAAANLEGYEWLVCASRRSVDALVRSRSDPWPRGLRTAAVGHATALALVDAGAEPAPVVASDSGSEALSAWLLPLDTWRGRRVLAPIATEGRRDLVESLRAKGALVDDVEAYRMVPRPDAAIREAWVAASPDATVIASPQTAETLVRVLGADAVRALKAVVAIGATTAAALAAHGIVATVPATANFTDAARCLAALAPKRA